MKDKEFYYDAFDCSNVVALLELFLVQLLNHESFS